MPHWIPEVRLNSDARLRALYPSVPPWEWHAHPVWRDRLLAAEHGEHLAREMLAEQAAANADQSPTGGNV